MRCLLSVLFCSAQTNDQPVDKLCEIKRISLSHDRKLTQRTHNWGNKFLDSARTMNRWSVRQWKSFLFKFIGPRRHHWWSSNANTQRGSTFKREMKISCKACCVCFMVESFFFCPERKKTFLAFFILAANKTRRAPISQQSKHKRGFMFIIITFVDVNS